MFRFLSASKRPVSTIRASFRPQLEDLEGREVPSGMQFVSAIVTNQVVLADQIKLDAGNLKQDLENAIHMPTVERMPVAPQEGTPPQFLPPASLFGPLFGNFDFSKLPSAPPPGPGLPSWDQKNAQGVTFGEAFMEGVDWEVLAPTFIDAPNIKAGRRGRHYTAWAKSLVTADFPPDGFFDDRLGRECDFGWRISVRGSGAPPLGPPGNTGEPPLPERGGGRHPPAAASVAKAKRGAGERASKAKRGAAYGGGSRIPAGPSPRVGRPCHPCLRRVAVAEWVRLKVLRRHGARHRGQRAGRPRAPGGVAGQLPRGPCRSPNLGEVIGGTHGACSFSPRPGIEGQVDAEGASRTPDPDTSLTRQRRKTAIVSQA
jgi:hypothetical protein